MEKALVSVIISTYNRKELLKETIASVQRQTYSDIEILVCDDGSSDSTEEMVREMMKSDTRIKYINCGHNGRPAIPRNVGIKESKGEWVAFTDDDDVWLPTKLEAQLYMMKKWGVKACCSNALKSFDGQATGEKYFIDSRTRLFKPRDLIDINPVICSSMIIDRDVLKQCVGFSEQKELRAIEDYAFWKRIAIYSPIVYIESPLLFYLMSSNSSIRSLEKISFAEQKELVDSDYFEWLKAQDFKRQLYFQIENWSLYLDKKKELLMERLVKFARRVKRRLKW